MKCKNSYLYLMDKSAIDTLSMTTNATTNGIIEWTSLASYVIGDEVVYNNRVYQAIIGNINLIPDSNTNEWLDKGVTPKYYAFDDSVNTISYGLYEHLTYSFYATNVDSMAFFNLSASSIQIRVTEDATGIEMYNETINLVLHDEYNSFHGFYFHQIGLKSQYINLEIPLTKNAFIEISIDYPLNTPEVGMIMVGRKQLIGSILENAKIGIQDFSRKDKNEYGEVDIVVRGYIDKLNLPIKLLSNSIDRVKGILTKYRSTPTVWMSDTQYLTLNLYAYYNDFSIVISSGVYSSADIQLEGLL